MQIEKLQSEVRQEQLARAALALIAADGLKKLSVARVAQRVGLVPSAIYRHFAGKNELLDAVLEVIREQLHANVAAVSDQTRDPMERLELLLMAHVRLIRENQGFQRVIFSDELDNGLPDRKVRVYTMISGYLKRVAGIVAEGQLSGSIRKDIDPDTVSVMFLGLIQPAAILWHMSAGKFDITRHVNKAWPVFRAAITAQ
ncbi:MAG: TetR/AcrR family transcriptional regulator [Acidobacteria bacterium]|nr:MAG: TetR/AcrR family transcriptional regulator [Acidobacteriota bacterium]